MQAFATSRPYIFRFTTFSCFVPPPPPLLCSCFILPASHHHLSLLALFFGKFSVIHIHLLASMLMIHLILSCIYFCLQHVALTPQAQGVLFSCGCSSSLIIIVHDTTCLSAGSYHQSSHYFSLLYCLRTKGLRSVLAFSLLLHEAHVTTSRPVCIFPLC